MDCPHISSLTLAVPSSTQLVYKEECTQCFDTIESPTGIDVCLQCFNGSCRERKPDHSQLHYNKRRHPVALNISRERKPKLPKAIPEKVEVRAERDEDLFIYRYNVHCIPCNLTFSTSQTPQIERVCEAIKLSLSSAQRSDVQTWELEPTSCEHVVTLEQQPKTIVNLFKCGECDLSSNLWLCLLCGHVGCGRKQYGDAGLPGNSHGLEHFRQTGHGVNAKLGSITADGQADIYCYICDNERTDPDLERHLCHWGIKTSEIIKTEKSLNELNVEHNFRHVFSLKDSDGNFLETAYGPGFIGLKNLGNTCYLSGVLQSLFSLQSFASRYLSQFEEHAIKCSVLSPADCLDCQMNKLADGLLSGRYSLPSLEIQAGNSVEQDGIAPVMFKRLIGKDHHEFSSMRQQDASEFFMHLLKTIQVQHRKSKRSIAEDPSDDFKFMVEESIRCQNCGRSKYRMEEQEMLHLPIAFTEGNEEPESAAIELSECLAAFFHEQEIEYSCPACSHNCFMKRTRLSTFPKHLVLTVQRFRLINWVPTKLEVPITCSLKHIDLSPYRSHGPRKDELLLLDDRKNGMGGARKVFIPDAPLLESIIAMGFPHNLCVKALYSVDNQGLEEAMTWLLSHPDDDGCMESTNVEKPQLNFSEDDEKVVTLADMGFSKAMAAKALSETDGEVKRAIDWLFSHDTENSDSDNKEALSSSEEKNSHLSDNATGKYSIQSIVCHKGVSVHTGHYVAYISKNELRDGWALFNDESVVKVPPGSEAFRDAEKYAYTYFLVAS